MIVTIDGPAGAGKSTVARKLAQRLGFDFLDTGAMYRAVASAALQRGVNLENPSELLQLARSVEIDLDKDKVLLDKEDISKQIRTPEVTASIRYVADHEQIREMMVEQQRKIVQGKNYVSEGRDQGTVAFPNADCKIFLTASPEVRAFRRQKDLEERGRKVPLVKVLEDLNIRDQQDATRPVGALKKAEDAIEVITDKMNDEQVVDRLVEIVESKRNPAAKDDSEAMKDKPSENADSKSKENRGQNNRTKPKKKRELSWFKRAGYQAVRYFAACNLFFFTGLRSRGTENIPRHTGALLCCNHASHLDPMLVGVASPRKLNFLARKTLYKFKPFGALISFLDAIPIDRDGMSLSGIKETLKRLKQNEIVLMFPEGTRSTDGQVQEFKEGFLVLARKSKVDLLPAALAGTDNAWPKGQKLPGFAKCVTVFGEIIPFESFKDMSDEELTELLRNRIIALHETAKQIIA